MVDWCSKTPPLVVGACCPGFASLPVLLILPPLPLSPAVGAGSGSGWVAQLVEQRTENPRVGGSIPSPATLWCGSLVDLVVAVLGGAALAASGSGQFPPQPLCCADCWLTWQFRRSAEQPSPRAARVNSPPATVRCSALGDPGLLPPLGHSPSQAAGSYRSPAISLHMSGLARPPGSDFSFSGGRAESEFQCVPGALPNGVRWSHQPARGRSLHAGRERHAVCDFPTSPPRPPLGSSAESGVAGPIRGCLQGTRSPITAWSWYEQRGASWLCPGGSFLPRCIAATCTCRSTGGWRQRRTRIRQRGGSGPPLGRSWCGGECGTA